jgi:hypothetical protein
MEHRGYGEVPEKGDGDETAQLRDVLHDRGQRRDVESPPQSLVARSNTVEKCSIADSAGTD